ncbi:MAG: RnfH family protein [Chromatiales bacterium]|nr:RnfH family protein [Chromatiales bacterium]
MLVEVAYALPDCQTVVELDVEEGTTAGAAIERSGILDTYPQLRGVTLDLGVFGELVSLDQPLEEGDRVEIYRPLIADPREQRRRRAAAKS